MRHKNPRASINIASDRLSDIREVVKTRQAKMRRQDLEKGAVRVFFVSFFTIFAAHFYLGTWNRLA